MTIIATPSLKQLQAQAGIVNGLANPCAITVFSGVQPDASLIAVNWSNYIGQILWHSQGFAFTVNGTIITATTIPTNSVAPIANGTGTWAIIWSTNVPEGVTTGQLRFTTIATPSFIVVPVSLNTGNGVIRFLSTTFNTTTPTMVVDAGITSI